MSDRATDAGSDDDEEGASLCSSMEGSFSVFGGIITGSYAKGKNTFPLGTRIRLLFHVV